MLRIVLAVIAGAFVATNVLAADPDNGRRLAQNHCAHCHIVVPGQRYEVAAAAPFDTIGRKYRFDADAIARTIAGPHPRMNFSPRPAEAVDIAAYIGTLK